MSTTCKSISSKIQRQGFPVSLYKGDGYFYFVFDDGVKWESESVYVFRLNQLSVDRWIDQGVSFAKSMTDGNKS